MLAIWHKTGTKERWHLGHPLFILGVGAWILLFLHRSNLSVKSFFFPMNVFSTSISFLCEMGTMLCHRPSIYFHSVFRGEGGEGAAHLFSFISYFNRIIYFLVHFFKTYPSPPPLKMVCLLNMIFWCLLTNLYILK